MKAKEYHTPVLLGEVVEFLDPKRGKSYVDATVGGGGHTNALLSRGARVLGIDRDRDAIEYIKNQVHSSQFTVRSLTLVQGNFADIGRIAKENGFGQVDGIIFDLGVSSHQLEESERGFSFSKSGPLDMRMDQTLPIRAWDIVNNFSERRLNEIFQTFGQEKFSRRIAGAICRARQIRPIEKTDELAKIIDDSIPRGVRKQSTKKLSWVKNSATKVFQALRIVVNSELINLEEALPQTIGLLKSHGRLAIVSFHSLEDGIVKRFLKKETRLRILTAKPIGPRVSEIESNPRSRSAKLRVAEKV